MVVKVDAIMAPPTSAVPLMAASFTETPCSICRKIFSTTTIALSTSIPAPNARPPKVIIFRVKPLKYIRLNVATMDIGIAKAIIAVTFMRRKKMKRTKTAISTPISAVSRTSFTDV